MRTATKAIMSYLKKNGKMSSKDIVADTTADKYDVGLAEADGDIVSVTPEHGGVDTWYDIR